MKATRKYLWLLMLTGMVLVCTSWWIGAEAEDTYNFYFQKAPGPTVVNQGVAGPTSPKDAAPDVVVKQDASGAAPVAMPAAPAAASSTAVAASEPAAPTGVRSFELSLGIVGARDSGGPDTSKGYYYSSGPGSGALNALQGVAGLQWNGSPYFGLQLSAYRLAKAPSVRIGGQETAATGTLWDYGADLVVTPLRLQAFGNTGHLNFALLVGGLTVPFVRGGENRLFIEKSSPSVGHAGSFAYGGRISLEFERRVSLQATVRKIDRYSTTQGVASLAFLL